MSSSISWHLPKLAVHEKAARMFMEEREGHRSMRHVNLSCESYLISFHFLHDPALFCIFPLRRDQYCCCLILPLAATPVSQSGICCFLCFLTLWYFRGRRLSFFLLLLLALRPRGLTIHHASLRRRLTSSCCAALRLPLAFDPICSHLIPSAARWLAPVGSSCWASPALAPVVRSALHWTSSKDHLRVHEVHQLHQLLRETYDCSEHALLVCLSSARPFSKKSVDTPSKYIYLPLLCQTVQPSCTSISRTTNSSFAAKIVFLIDRSGLETVNFPCVPTTTSCWVSSCPTIPPWVLKTSQLDNTTDNLRLKPERWCRRGVSLPEREMWSIQESQTELSLRSAQQIWLDKERMSSSGQSSTKDRNQPWTEQFQEKNDT